MFNTCLGSVVLTVCTFAACIVAASDPPLPPASAAPAEEMREGKVMMVSRDAIMIMGDLQSDVTTFAVNAQTKVTLNGKLVSIQEIQMGDRATVSGRMINNELTASVVSAVSGR